VRFSSYPAQQNVWLIHHYGTKEEPEDTQADGPYPGMLQVISRVPGVRRTALPWSIRRMLMPRDKNSPRFVDRKVRALLNKLTMETFDSISEQILEWANRSVNEVDGRTLIQVTRLVFDKATDEEIWSEMYARLCRFLVERISQDVRDEGIHNVDGKPIAGGNLFRKYLLNRCQEGFERGWSAREAAMLAAVSKAPDDETLGAAIERASEGEKFLHWDEWSAYQRVRRRGLGLVKFIGELFKLQMLTERIMHECIQTLLGNVVDPGEEKLESLCKLLVTVGQVLDTPKARKHMDIYFGRMQELATSGRISSKIQWMLIVSKRNVRNI
jgi:translation initiation factor 4G